jgi:hypothetical protein
MAGRRERPALPGRFLHHGQRSGFRNSMQPIPVRAPPTLLLPLHLSWAFTGCGRNVLDAQRPLAVPHFWKTWGCQQRLRSIRSIGPTRATARAELLSVCRTGTGSRISELPWRTRRRARQSAVGDMDCKRKFSRRSAVVCGNQWGRRQSTTDRVFNLLAALTMLEYCCSSLHKPAFNPTLASSCHTLPAV